MFLMATLRLCVLRNFVLGGSSSWMLWFLREPRIVPRPVCLFCQAGEGSGRSQPQGLDTPNSGICNGTRFSKTSTAGGECGRLTSMLSPKQSFLQVVLQVAQQQRRLGTRDSLSTLLFPSFREQPRSNKEANEDKYEYSSPCVPRAGISCVIHTRSNSPQALSP